MQNLRLSVLLYPLALQESSESLHPRTLQVWNMRNLNVMLSFLSRAPLSVRTSEIIVVVSFTWVAAQLMVTCGNYTESVSSLDLQSRCNSGLCWLVFRGLEVSVCHRWWRLPHEFWSTHLIISVSSNSDLSYSVKVLSHGENVTVNSRCSNAWM